MNNYKLQFYFTDNTNIETRLSSELEIEDFAKDFSNKNLDKKFITFINKSSITINLEKVMFFTIEKVVE